MMRMIRTKFSRLALALTMLFVVVAAVTTISDVAHAQPKWKLQQEAKAAYGAGKKKMDAGDYAGALPDFLLADEKWPGAAPKYNIALCYDKLGKNAEAVAAYRAFIDSKPDAKYADRVIAAGKRIEELKANLEGTITLAITPANVQGVAVKIDGTAATGAEIKLSPGPHTVEVSAPGYQPVSQQVDVLGGKTLSVPVMLQVAPPPEPVEPPSSGSSTANVLRIAGFVSLGVGVVGGVLTAVFGVQALGAKDDFDAAPSNDLADDAEDSALLSDVFLGVGGAFGVAGIILLAAGYSMDSDGGDTAVRVLPMAGPQGGGVALTVDF